MRVRVRVPKEIVSSVDLRVKITEIVHGRQAVKVLEYILGKHYKI